MMNGLHNLNYTKMSEQVQVKTNNIKHTLKCQGARFNGRDKTLIYGDILKIIKCTNQKIILLMYSRILYLPRKINQIYKMIQDGINTLAYKIVYQRVLKEKLNKQNIK